MNNSGTVMALKRKRSPEKNESNDETSGKASPSLGAAADKNKDETKDEDDKYYLSDFAKAVIIEAMCKTPDMNNPTMIKTKSDEEDIAEFDNFVMPPRHKKRKKKHKNKNQKRKDDSQCSTSVLPSTSNS